MKTLTIKDLARTEELDSHAMGLVRGGWSMYTPGYKVGDLSYAPSWDSSMTATQNLLQQQSVTTATANGAAFVHGVHVNSDVHQDGQNNIIG
ncbi:hypothetical protein ACHAC9_02670 [Massilia sp. CMS3.1]|uniref:hypothetical protein n=1 Tax=Massilia sp. CMS3.1 TaxID=3373083 RepID=UPI003EE61C4B